MPPQLAAFFASKLFKIGLGVAALIAVLLIVRSTVGAIHVWETSIRNEGYTSGVNITEARWQKASAKSMLDQRDRIATDAIASNSAVTSYMADIANRAPLLIPVKERTEVYAQSPDSNTVCLDANGVGLWKDYRTASGLYGPSPAAIATPGPVQPALPQPGTAARQP